jgi:integrase
MSDDPEIEALQAEIEQLKKQLGRSKPRDFTFLGETIPGEMLGDVSGQGKLWQKIGAYPKRRLDAREVTQAPDGMHGDGGNLWLQVTPGGRSWIFRYRWGEKQREMGLNALSDVPLAEARARAVICRRLVRVGVDPIARRRELAMAIAGEAKRVTFKDAAERYIAAHRGAWSAKHAAQWPSTMATYAYPIIGSLSVADVDTDRVHQVLEPIWTTKHVTASRVRGRIEKILDWAAVMRMRQGDNPARWRGHLEALLQAPTVGEKHHPALPWQRMHDFWSALYGRNSTSAEALRFLILTFSRTSEVTGAKWSEIDLNEKVWTVPAERMKGRKGKRRQHRVALSDAAVEVLQRMAPLKVHDTSFIFPGAVAEKPLSNMAMAMLIRGMNEGDGAAPWVDLHGDEIVPHGFRSSASDWRAEATSYPRDLMETALAHTIESKVEAAYRRGDMVDRRRDLMAAWARHVTEAAPADNVVPLASAAR